MTTIDPVRQGTQRLADFEALYASSFPRIALVAGTTAGDRAFGEDCAQEAFARAHSKWHRVGTLDQPGAWVRRAAINLALSRRRRIGREARAVARLGSMLEPDTGVRSHAHVWDAVGQLPPRQRAVVALHYHEGMSVAEIADTLDCSISAATSNLHKARTRLAILLGDHPS